MPKTQLMSPHALEPAWLCRRLGDKCMGLYMRSNATDRQRYLDMWEALAIVAHRLDENPKFVRSLDRNQAFMAHLRTEFGVTPPPELDNILFFPLTLKAASLYGLHI